MAQAQTAGAQMPFSRSILPGSEAKRPLGASDRHIRESGSLQPSTESEGVHNHHGIEQMHELKPAAPYAVGSNKYAPGFQNAAHLADQPVLQRHGRNVM